MRPEELPALIRTIRDTLAEDTSTPPREEAPTSEKPTRAQIRKSITPEALISFVDGKPYKTLKRHLTGAGMTMAEYRERYGLPGDYPSVAPAFSERRREVAKQIGLGTRGRGAQAEAPAEAEPEPTPVPEPTPAPKAARGARRKAKPADAAETAGANSDDAAPQG